MPDGLKYLLSPDDNTREKVVVVLKNRETSLFHWEFVSHLVKRFNKEESSESSAKGCKTHVLHVILHAIDKDTLDFSSHLTHVYDDLDVQIDDLSRRLMANRQQEEHVDARHIVIIEDLSLLSLLSALRDSSRLSKFLRLICRNFDRTFVFGNSSTLTNQEISSLYEIGTAVAVLGKHHQEERNYRTKASEPLTMVCDLLKLRNEKRVSHEQTKFQVLNGEIVELKESLVSAPPSDHQTDVLKNLTTFKLTVEDNEKETRSKLYLPYFNAQKEELDTELDYQEYDDEDEEV